MAEDVEVKVGVQVDGAKTIKDLKKDLKEAQGQAIALSRTFGETSKEAQDAAKKVAMLKDEIADVNERVQLFDPGAKFKAFGNVVQSVAGGFTAAQGAMAVFGAESQDLQKQLVKLQGALAITEGLSTITDSAKDFQRLGSIIKTQLVSAFTTLRGAIIATGIGALAVAVGVLITNFDKVEAAIKRLFPAFEGFAAAFNKVKAVAAGVLNGIIESFRVIGDIVGKVFEADFSGAVETAKGAGKRIGAAYAEGFQEEVADQAAEAARKAVEAQIKADERVLKVLQASGEKRAVEAADLERKILEARIKAVKEGTDEYLDAQADLAAYDAKIAEERRKKQEENAKKAKADREAAAQKALQELQRRQDLEYEALTIAGKDVYYLKRDQLAEQLDFAKKNGLDTASIQKQQEAEELSRRKAFNKELQSNVYSHNSAIKTDLVNTGAAIAELGEKLEASQEKGKLTVQEAEAAKQAAYQQTIAYVDFLAAATQQGSELEQAAALAGALAIQWAELSKQDSMEKTTTVLQTAGKILGQQTAAGKAVAIAAATIETYKAAQSSFTALSPIPIVGPALGAAAAIAAVVAGIARVKQISSIKIPGAGSGAAGPTPTIPNAPTIPRVQSNTGVMVDQLDQLNSNMNQSVRVKVVESDITDAQKRVAKIEENATF